MNRWVMIVFSLTLTILAMASVGLEGVLAAGTTAAATTIKLSSSQRLDDNGTSMKGQLILAATMTTGDGKAVSGRPVSFYENVDLLGPRQALLGTATTDSTGSAAIAYQPSQPGSQTIVARSEAGGGFAAAQGEMSLNVVAVDPPFKPEAKPLTSIGDALAIVFGVATASTWLVLFGVLIRAIVGIRSSGRLASAESTAASDSALRVIKSRNRRAES